MHKFLAFSIALTSIAGCSTAPERVSAPSAISECSVDTSATVNYGVRVSGVTRVECGEQSTFITNQCITKYRSVPPNGEEFMFKCPDDKGGFVEGSMTTYW